jgi:hypothetical protein
MYSIIVFALLSNTPDGTLLFVEGGNELVMSHTNSPYSHAAVIFNDNGKLYVYEATHPVCRKVLLEDYIKLCEKINKREGKQIKLWIKYPKNLSHEDAEKMKEYCEKQLGRKYRIKSYIRGEPQEKSIHCGEMTTRAMIAGGMDVKDNPCDRTPRDIFVFSKKWYEEEVLLWPN